MSEEDPETKLKAKYGALPNQKQLLEKRMRQGHGGGEKKHFDSADWAQTLAAQPPAAAPETESAEPKPEGGKTIVTEGQTMLPPAPSTKS